MIRSQKTPVVKMAILFCLMVAGMSLSACGRDTKASDAIEILQRCVKCDNATCGKDIADDYNAWAAGLHRGDRAPHVDGNKIRKLVQKCRTTPGFRVKKPAA